MCGSRILESLKWCISILRLLLTKTSFPDERKSKIVTSEPFVLKKPESVILNLKNACNRVYCIHVPGHDPLIFSFLSFILFDWVGVLWPQLSKVSKLVRWACSVPFPPSVPAEAGSLFAVAAGVHVFIQGRAYTCFLVGWCKVMLWQPLTCDSSSMLPTCFPSTPHPHSPTFVTNLLLFEHQPKTAR